MPHEHDPDAVNFDLPEPDPDDTGEFEVQPYDESAQPTGRMEKPEEPKLRDAADAKRQLEEALRDGTRQALELALRLTDSVKKPPAGTEIPRAHDVNLNISEFDEPEEDPLRVAAKKYMGDYRQVLQLQRKAREMLEAL